MRKLSWRCKHSYDLYQVKRETYVISFEDHTECQCLCSKCFKIKFFTLRGDWSLKQAEDILRGRKIIR